VSFIVCVVLCFVVLMGKPEGRRPLGRPRRRWVGNIKMDLREIGWDGEKARRKETTRNTKT
jgi:hypothetical protein